MITITSNYAQNAAATLDTELGGTSPGSGYDQLVVGTANLGGTLKLTLINGFVPNVGETFDVVTYNSHSGEFLTVMPTNFPPGMGASVSYTGGAGAGVARVTVTGP